MKLNDLSLLQIAKIFLGCVCILLGSLAFFTPLTPGSWLVFVGLELLGIRFIAPGWMKRLLKRLGWKKKNHP